MKIILFAALIAPCVLQGLDDPPPGPVMHAETRVVQIDVAVVDSHGKPVTDLTKQDFTIRDEGKPRPIDIFSFGRGGVADSQTAAVAAPSTKAVAGRVFSNRDPKPPAAQSHSTVLVLDQVNAFIEDAAYGRDQVISLMKKVPADERIALYVIARKQGLLLLQDYTTDHELLLESLRKYTPNGLHPSPPPPPSQANKSGNTSGVGDALKLANEWARGSDQPSPPGLPNEYPPPSGPEKLAMWQENSLSTRLSLQALSEHLALLPGRKSIFWITQGMPNWLIKEVGMWTPPAMDTEAWNKTFTALNEADVAVNPVDSRGIFRGGNPNTGTLDTMNEIAGRTGGKAYIRRNDLDDAMEEGIEASRATYTLGFYLTAADRDRKFHALQVLAGRPGLQLFYRQGYYAGDTDMPDASKDSVRGGALEGALLNQIDSAAVLITARIDSIATDTPRGTIHLRLTLDPSTLSLSEHQGGWTGTIEEMFIETNDTGATLGKVSDKKEFDVLAAMRARFDTDGIAWPMEVPLADGANKLTIVMRDTKSGRTGSLTMPLK